MAQIILHLADNLAERLAPFRDRLPELLERGLRDLLGSPIEDDQVTINAPAQRLEALKNLHQLRSNIQAQRGIYSGNLVAEARLVRENDLNQTLDSAS